MKKQQKQLLIFIALAVGGYFVYQWWKEKEDAKKSEQEQKGGETASVQKPAPATTVTDKTTLSKANVGTYIEQVAWIQNYYNRYVAPKTGRALIEQDGKFGTKTEQAVKFVTGKTSTSWYEFSTIVAQKYKS